MGLLNTVLETQDHKKKSGNDFFLLESRLPENKEYPEENLKLLNNYFKLDKSIYLTYDAKTDMWFPLASSGFDVTSVRRMRFNQKFFSSAAENGFTIIEDKESLAKFKTYLSIREYSMLRKIDLLHKGNCAFLTLNSPLTPSSPSFNEYVKAVEFSLNKIKKIQFVNKDDNDRSSLSITLFVSQYIKKHKESHVYFIKLNYKEMVSFIIDSLSENQESIQLAQDIFDIVYSMVNISGRLLHLEAYSALLLFSSETIQNPKLLTTQITSMVKNYFNITSDLPSIEYSFVTYPEEGKTIEDLLGKLDIL